MAYYVDTHPDFTDCFVLRNADTGEWQYVGDEDYVIEEVDGWGDVCAEAIGYKTQAAAELAAANHGGCMPRPVNTWSVGDDLTEWEARDRFTREDHHAHVVDGWQHHWATAHTYPDNDVPF